MIDWCKDWAAIFRKNSNGSIPATTRWILTPYLLYVTIYNRVKRYSDPVPPMQKIIDKLYVGARLNKRQTRKLEIWLKQDIGNLKYQQRACIIANPVAGKGKWKESGKEIQEKLSSMYSLDVYETTEEINAKSLAQEALKKNYDLIVACGGDGTLNEVVDVIGGSKKLMLFGFYIIEQR